MTRLASIRHVRQEDPFGCQYACMAMLAGVTYADVREKLGDPGRGTTHHLWHEALARYGFAYQFHFKYDPTFRGIREPWPMPLWAPAHLCAVDAGNGPGSHVVVALGDGSVLDPNKDGVQRWESYGGIGYMAGIWDVGCSAGPL